MNKYLTLAVATGILLSASCKKKSSEKTTCTSALYGVTIPGFGNSTPGPGGIIQEGIGTGSWGAINESSGAVSVADSFYVTMGGQQSATYCTADNCFYLEAYSNIFRITSTGASTTLTGTGPIGSLQYDAAANKFYSLLDSTVMQVASQAVLLVLQKSLLHCILLVTIFSR